MKNTDLHSHSYYSDGEFSPKEIVRQAKKIGIKTIALTDHNSVKGIDEAINEGKKIGINVIPGVEISAKQGEVLGQFIDYKNPKIKKELKKCGANSNEKVLLITRKLGENKIKASEKEFKKLFFKAEGNYNKGHLIYYLLKKGFSEKEINEIQMKIRIKPRTKKVSVEFAIKLIKKFHGIPVLAHPWISKELLQEKKFSKLVKAGLLGIELENGDFNRFGRDKKTVNQIKKLARKFNLILTQGSDFHGPIMTKSTKGHELGKYNCDEKVIKQLEEIKLKQIK